MARVPVKTWDETGRKKVYRVSYLLLNSRGNSAVPASYLSKPGVPELTGRIAEVAWKGVTVNGNSYYDVAFDTGQGWPLILRTARDAVSASISVRNLEGKTVTVQLTKAGRIYGVKRDDS